MRAAAIEMIDQVSPNTSLREWDHLITHLGVEHNLLTHLDWMRSDEALIAAGKESSIKQVFQEKISKELINRLRSERKEWTYVDYILLLGETADPSLSFNVEKIDVHDFDHPDDNLSDHHALLGRVKS